MSTPSVRVRNHQSSGKASSFGLATNGQTTDVSGLHCKLAWAFTRWLSLLHSSCCAHVARSTLFVESRCCGKLSLLRTKRTWLLAASSKKCAYVSPASRKIPAATFCTLFPPNWLQFGCRWPLMGRGLFTRHDHENPRTTLVRHLVLVTSLSLSQLPPHCRRFREPLPYWLSSAPLTASK